MSSKPQSEHSEQSDSWEDLTLTEAVEYSKSIINAVGAGIENVFKAKDEGLIIQKQKAEEFGEKLKKNQGEIMKAFLFSLKKDFRGVYIEWITRLTEVAEE